MRTRRLAYLFVTAALTASAGLTAEPLFFIEDFCGCLGPGDSTIECRVPFFTLFGSSLQVTSEGIELRNSGDWASAFFVGPSFDGAPIYSDYSVRARMRKERRVGGIGITSRYSSDPICYDAELVAFASDDHLVIYRGGGGIYIMCNTLTSFNAVDEDVIFQVDQVGQSLKLWAWSPSKERPLSAQCAGTGDMQVPPGRIGFYSYKPSNDPGTDPSSWRYIMVFPTGEEPFLRGDANGDGAIDISDAVRILNYLFTGEEDTACLDAADNDDGGAVDISDPIYLLNHLFLGKPAPAAPFGLEGTCGVDPTPFDGLTCLRYMPCESYMRECER